MELIERIQYLMKLKGLSASAFADQVGVQRSSVSHVLSGRNKPSLEFIQKVLVAFPKVDASWLISGKKENSKADSSNVQEDRTTLAESLEESSSVSALDAKQNNQKTIEKVIVYYSDQTFEVLNPQSAQSATNQ